MAKEESRMPAGIAGITSYSEVNPKKLKFTPEQLMVFVGLVVLLEFLLYIFIPF